VTNQRPVSAVVDPADAELETTLRPRRLPEFIGQARVREQLELVLEGARRRGAAPDHVLLSGPPGLGKTSLAMIIAAELGSAIRVTSRIRGPISTARQTSRSTSRSQRTRSSSVT